MSEFDDPFGVHRHSRPSGLHTEDGKDIRFVGQNILAIDPRTNDLYGLSEYFDHPLLSGQYFYAPANYIEFVTRWPGRRTLPSLRPINFLSVDATW